MPRKPIRSRKIPRPVLSDFVRILLIDGPGACHDAMVSRVPGTGKAEAFKMRGPAQGVHPDEGIFKRYPLMVKAWKTHRDEIMHAWSKRVRPWAARQFD